jgi:DNA-binding NtrC family response regulator
MIPILYVDDDPGLLEICTLFFERTGEIEIDTASSVYEANKKMSSHSYECIIADYQMPGMNGIQFLQELRSRGNMTPFILFTSYNDDDSIKEAAYRRGAFSVVGKNSAEKNTIHTLIRTVYWAVLYDKDSKRSECLDPDTHQVRQEDNYERNRKDIDREPVRSEI